MQLVLWSQSEYNCNCLWSFILLGLHLNEHQNQTGVPLVQRTMPSLKISFDL